VEEEVWYDTLTVVQTVRDTVQVVRELRDTVVKEVEIAQDVLVYVVIEKATGTEHRLEWDGRVSINGDDVQIAGLSPEQPVYIYTIRGVPYASGHSDADGVFVLRNIPAGLYILEYGGSYSKFIR